MARVLVVGALALATYLVRELDVRDPFVRDAAHAGLGGWDAAYYADIAARGYSALPRAAVRFFPLLSLLARPLVWVGFSGRAAVVIVSNVSALVAACLLYALVRREGRDEALARRAAWFLALAPSAFVLVMGYSEATSIALAIGAFLALRARRWWIAAALGVLVGLSRPSGFLLAVPATIEAARGIRGIRPKEYLARCGAALGPAIGTVLYLAWVGGRFGDFWLPYSLQTEGGRRGSFTNPLHTIEHAVRGLARGDTIGTGLHVPWLALVAVLLVVCIRTWPASYSAFVGVGLLTAIVSSNLESVERYSLASFPLILVVATLTTRTSVERVTLVLSGAAMTTYALLTFLHAYVP